MVEGGQPRKEQPLFGPRGGLFRKVSTGLSSPEQLDQLVRVTNPRGWVALVALCALVATAGVWGALGTVRSTVQGRGMLLRQPGPDGAGAGVRAVCYIDPRDGQTVRPGMPVEVVPLSVRTEESGFVHGVVSSVGAGPATIQQMTSLLGDERLAELMAPTPAIEVFVDLRVDPSTPSGYRWSSGRGPAVTFPAGTLLTGRIVYREQPPFALVIPYLRGAMGTGPS